MADTKITALTALTAADPANDVIPIVDISDTSMAASGTTKKISVNNILGASGTATLASATITGDLTVDTSTLKVDSTNNRVGVLNTPTVPFEVTGLIAASSGAFQAGAANGIFAALNNDGTNPGLDLRRWTGSANNHGTAYIATSSAGDALFYTDSQASNTKATSLRMTLNSTGLGVGVTPSAGKGALQLSSGINFPATQVASSDVNTLDDYEEGTFTPTIVGATTAGTGTYVAQNGRYTKVGNLVTFQAFLDWTAHTGTGNMRIGNLPFANGGSFWAGSIGYLNNIALTAGNIMTAYVEASQSYVTLQQYPTGGGATSGVPIDTSGAIMFSGSYTI